MAVDDDDGATGPGWLAAAQAGDEAGFRALVDAFYARVQATCLRLLGNRADAADATQDTFVRIHRGLAGFDGRAELSTWIYRIAVNTALNHGRSRGRAQALANKSEDQVGAVGGRPEALGEPPDPAVQAVLADEARQTLEALAELSPPLRVTLALVAVEGLSHREVASLLEIPEGTVAWRVNEARQQLRLALAKKIVR